MLHRRSPIRKGNDDVEGGDLFGEGKVEVNATKRTVLGHNLSLRSIFIATVMLLALITHYLRAPDAAVTTAVATDNVALQSSPHNNVTSTSKLPPPSFLHEAIDHCKAAKKEHGEYPSMSEKIVDKRILRWRNNQRKDNFLQMINDKLGGYMFASKHGVRTPRVLFCGKAKDISKSMDSFGNKYVIKPLKGHSAQGVKVVRDGLDIMANETVSYGTLMKEYLLSEIEMMVEELIESANPKYDGLIPPDYKFFTYGGGRTEFMWYIDRNEEECCSIFDVSSNNGMKFLKDVVHHQYPTSCPIDIRKELEEKNFTRQNAMKDAAQILASNIGPNWMRIDMYDSSHGPVLGEFTPFSAKGHGEPLHKCILSYLFIRHAEYGVVDSDDRGLIHDSFLDDAIKFKNMTRMKTDEARTKTGLTNGIHFEFQPPEAREWLQLDEMTKCKKVMEIQLLQ
jgi:hypothetical protein